MDVLLHNFSVCEYKTHSKRKKYMLTLGLEPMWFVSEEYCHHALMRSAISGCGKQAPSRNIHPWKYS
jgi:prophage antirepressor-like protein